MLEQLAVIANLTVHSWTARAHERRGDDAVVDAYDCGGTPGAVGRYTKRLVDHTYHTYKVLVRSIGALRAAHRTMTLPWGEGGRLLPASLLEDYKRDTERLGDYFLESARVFQGGSKFIKAEAAQRLGRIYVEADYDGMTAPDAFSWAVTYTPVPTDDFRVGMSAGMRKTMMESVRRVEREAVAGVVPEIVERMAAALQRVVTVTGDPEARVYQSLLENVRTLGELLPNFNLLGDPRVAAVIADFACLGAYTKDDIQSSVVARQQCNAQALQVMERLKGVGQWLNT